MYRPCITSLIDQENVTETLLVKAGTAEVLPFRWIKENRNLGILCKSDDLVVPRVLIETMLKTFRYQPGAPPDKEMQGKLVPLFTSANHASSVLVGCDFTAFTCHKIDAFAPYQYLVSINAPLLIHNYLPRPLEVSVYFLLLIQT